MKNVLMEMKDKLLLRKRAIIETINDELKNICSVEHSRPSYFGNLMSNYRMPKLRSTKSLKLIDPVAETLYEISL